MPTNFLVFLRVFITLLSGWLAFSPKSPRGYTCSLTNGGFWVYLVVMCGYLARFAVEPKNDGYLAEFDSFTVKIY